MGLVSKNVSGCADRNGEGGRMGCVLEGVHLEIHIGSLERLSSKEQESIYACLTAFLRKIEFTGRAGDEVMSNNSIDFGAERLDCDYGTIRKGTMICLPNSHDCHFRPI